MAERTATIASNAGLHARPAAVFAEAASHYEHLDITIAVEGEPQHDVVDAASMLSLMSLGAGHGERVVLRADGHGAEEALDQLAQILGTDHDTK
ncbi:HPr family phosphocarrier protein [bacterium RCC_150]